MMEDGKWKMENGIKKTKIENPIFEIEKHP